MNDSEKQSMKSSSKKIILPLIFTGVIIILIVLSFLGIAGVDLQNFFGGAMSRYNYEHMMMDTFVTISIFTDEGKEKADDASKKAFNEMERLEAMLHRKTEGSDIWNINENAGITAVSVDKKTFELIQKGIKYGDLTGGAFDITIAPLMDLWGFGLKNQVPTPSLIEEKLRFVNYKRIALEENNYEVYLEDKGMALDLGGIAKGYIVDRGMEVLEDNGIKMAFLNAGGDIRLIGGKPEDEPWVVGIKNPRDEDGLNPLKGKISLFDSAVVTSGDYQRYFEEDGRRYHHIIDPGEGYPADNLLSVTIVHNKALDADILSTAIFVMGKEEGFKLIEKLPDAEAVIINPEMETFYSDGLEDIFELIP